jgi:hypothetical protein
MNQTIILATAILKKRITTMKSCQLLVLGLSVLVFGGGCQHAASPSLAMQKKFFSSLKDANPEEDRALRHAHYYQLVGRYDLAVKELSPAVAADPHNIRLLNGLGSCYDKMGSYAQAQEIYARILSQDPGHNPAKNNLGYSYFLSGDLVKAESLFQEILAHDPSNTVAKNNLGLVWCRQGKDSQALNLWQKTEGELAAREKYQQILAYLGQSGEKAVTGDTNAKTATLQIPGERHAVPDKPEKRAQPEELARSSKKPVPSQPPTLIAADRQPTAPQPARSAGTEKKFPQEPQVTVEEVQMVIQPASYSPPPVVGSPTAEEAIPTIAPRNRLPEKSVPGINNPGKTKTVLSDDDLDEIDTEPPRRFYRPRQWKRYWKPRMITSTPQEPQKPVKPLKEYINSGLSHRSASGGPEAPIY